MPEYLLKYQCWPNGCGKDWTLIRSIRGDAQCPCCGKVKLPYYTETLKDWS